MTTVLLAAILLLPAHDHAAPPPQLSAQSTGAPVEVTMDLRWQKPAIQVKLNGTGPYWFILDSGAGPYLIVDADLAAELKLPSEGKQAIGDPTNPHALTVDKVLVDRVEVGQLVYEGMESLTWDKVLYSGTNRPRGIVGMGLFGGRLITLDYPAGMVRIEKGSLPEPDGITVLNAPMSHNVPSIEIQVNGTPIMARLDTGSTGFLSLPTEYATRLPLTGEPIEVGRAHTVNNEYPVLASTLKGEVRVGGLKVENPVLNFLDTGGANVGTDLLRHLVVTIDKGTQRVRLISDGRPILPSSRPRLGIVSTVVQNGRIPVTRLTPGSPAEKAGVRVGDAVTKINGESVAPMKAGDLALALRASPLRLTLLREGAEMEVDVDMEPAP